MSHLILPKNYDPLIDLIRKRDSTTISTAWKEE